MIEKQIDDNMYAKYSMKFEPIIRKKDVALLIVHVPGCSSLMLSRIESRTLPYCTYNCEYELENIFVSLMYTKEEIIEARFSRNKFAIYVLNIAKMNLRNEIEVALFFCEMK